MLIILTRRFWLLFKVSPSLSMVDQINRLRAMEASSASASTLSPNSALSAGGFNSLDVSGASAKPAAGGGGPQLASARSESRPSRPTTTVTDLRKDVTRMEVAAEVGSEKIKCLGGEFNPHLGGTLEILSSLPTRWNGG